MTAPFFEYGLFGPAFSLVVALIIGVAFGWCLERSGMGSARKLMGQFYLTDLTVFKVMFTAIITAMLGIFWLGWIGVLDIARVYVPETYILPQLVGGIIFGVGFATAGLCPGTSCVSAVTGRGDGVAGSHPLHARWPLGTQPGRRVEVSQLQRAQFAVQPRFSDQTESER